MSRPLRIEYPGAWYHVMNRGVNRQPIFQNDQDLHAFLTLAGQTSTMWNLEVHAYALMTNHYHLLVHTPDGNLSRAMRHLGSVYAQRYNQRRHRDGPVFRGRYKAILIEAESYLLQLVRYIHLNPVKAGLVADPAQYPWSSHRFYLTQKKQLDWLVTEEVLGRFGTTWRAAAQQYREFVAEGVPQSISRLYDQKIAPVIVGTEGFKMWVEEILRAKERQDYEIPEPRNPRLRPGIEAALAVCQREYPLAQTDLTVVRRGRRNEARDVLIYLSRRECGLPLKRIAQSLGIRTYTTVSMACSRVEARAEKSLAFRRKLRKLAGHIRQPTIVN